jgi:hypothetical protein
MFVFCIFVHTHQMIVMRVNCSVCYPKILGPGICFWRVLQLVICRLDTPVRSVGDPWKSEAAVSLLSRCLS